MSKQNGIHQAKFIDNFPSHFFVLFERNQCNFQTKYSKLVDTRIKCEDNLNFSFWSMANICGMPIITPSYLQLLVRAEEELTKVTLLRMYVDNTKSYCTMMKK